ncbi:MAG TPA: translation initiation factor IF-3 [Clostridiales bacterium]|jgi:translation initiation factor IF-3|nr:translation initiation factor IF-3 [Clostridiales bacterium]
MHPILFGKILWRCHHIANNDLLINDQIREKEVRLIDEDGSQLGVVELSVAQRMADERGLDLVLIAPQAKPPVCKITDYSKFKFEKIKREKEQRKAQKTIEMKEVRLSATIDTHDLEVKSKAAIKFLQNGDKVKASIRFKGRQITHGEIGQKVMDDFFKLVEEYAVIDRPPKIEGRSMFMILSPKPQK